MLSLSIIYMGEEMQEFEDKILGYEINTEFKIALDAVINKGENVLIGGSAGVGKSVFVDIITSLLQGKNIVKIAPTGIAALNIGGETIHKFFGFGLGGIHLGRFSGNLYNQNFLDIVKNLDILIIDEISLCRSDVFENINYMLQNSKDQNKPFGGVQIILTGDAQQLSPIVKDEEDKFFLEEGFGGEYFFETFSYKEGNFKCIEFVKNYRQKDQEFRDNLNLLGRGKITSDLLAYFNKRVMPELEYAKIAGDKYVHIVTTNKKKDQINNSYYEAIKEKEFESMAVITGLFKKENSNMDFCLKLKKGCIVMALKNSFTYKNGSIGKVVDFQEVETDKGLETVVVVDFEGLGLQNVSLYEEKMIEYSYDRKDKKIKENEIGKIVQYPLTLAFARSCHKSQGMTFDKVYLDIGTFAFANSLAYVGLSRCRSYEMLGLARPIKGYFCKVDEKVKKFIEKSF